MMLNLNPVPQMHRMSKVPFEDEKPVFHTNQQLPGPSEPFVLSGTIQVPYTINRYLRGYQREGVKFIYDSFIKSRGCILGDDMGLGKTIQVGLYNFTYLNQHMLMCRQMQQEIRGTFLFVALNLFLFNRL